MGSRPAIGADVPGIAGTGRNSIFGSGRYSLFPAAGIVDFLPITGRSRTDVPL